ncbi:MAG: hydantoinase/oxoprolinase family protein, partial [Planctomycetes bacterium]|nr:hydantoinase/oxoprolinase family protein [Planctomycetota bacterium]
EYERFVTTVINAYVAPVMVRYLGRLAARLPGSDLRIMASSGGSVTVPAACAHPVTTLLSGPSAGVVAGAALQRARGAGRAITFDMGGTSTDVALLDGGLRLTKEGRVGDLPVRVPMVEIHTVGAGGGSLARFDAGGALRVGPQSAGARPGPACYGFGGVAPTVTDANLLLGRIDAARFFGGRLRLDRAAARRAVGRLAPAILDVVDSNMERALRFLSVERGHDPARFELIACGGAGPLHACALARALGMPRVVVPLRPGNFCALGALLADVVKEASQSVLSEIGKTPDFAPLEARCLRALRAEGIAPDGPAAAGRLRVRRLAELRYRGQSWEILLPWEEGADMRRRFAAAHRRRYGFALPDRAVEIVNLLVRVEVRTRGPRFAPLAPRRGRFTGSIDRAELGRGSVIRGPAIISEDNATTFVPRDFAGEVGRFGELLLEPR